MRRRNLYYITIALLFFGANFFVWNIESQTRPFTKDQILNAINSINKAIGNQKKVLSDKILKDINQRGVDFPLTKENETLLRNEGATDELIDTIRQNSPPLPTPMPTARPISTPVPTRTPTPMPLSTPTPTPSPIPPPTPTPEVKIEEMKNSIGMELVKIPSGSFEMGSNDGRSDEKPVHRVTISKGFYMGKYEVTQEEYKKVMGKAPSNFKNCPRCPIEQVSWDDAQGFVRKLNTKNEGTYRLPTEAEWEYAARAGTTTQWSFGGSFGSERQLKLYAWYRENSEGKTHEVGTKEPNDFGLYDMHGNVWEWTQDWYGSYGSGSETDPTGASSGSFRVFRGGGWGYDAEDMRSAVRFSNSPSFRSGSIGFRLLMQ